MSLTSPALFSFFSGLGFLDLGLEMSGFEIVRVNEKHPPFLDAYKYSRNAMNIPEPRFGYHEEDVAVLLDDSAQGNMLAGQIASLRSEGRCVGFVGGPPCPDFSVGGKNKGRHGLHGQLSQTYVELLCSQLPDFFVFENVKGLWQTKPHRAYYEELKKQLHRAGYVTTERLINAIEYGAPQDRPRIILIGFKQEFLEKNRIALGMYDKKNCTVKDDSFPWLRFAVYPGETGFLWPWPKHTPFVEDCPIPIPAEVPEELTVEFWFRKNDVDHHPNARHCFRPRAGIARFMAVSEGDDSRKSFKRLHRWRYSPTACYGNNEVHLHPYKARRLSAAEALAIQTLPKDFELPPDMTLSNMFKGIGNGVPLVAAQRIGSSILSFLKGDE